MFKYEPSEQTKAFWAVQEATALVLNGVTNALKDKDNRRGIPIYSTSTKRNGRWEKRRIKERDGKEILTVSWAGVFRLETSTLKVYQKHNAKTILSELNATGTWNHTTYTEEGKQINGQPLKPFTQYEGNIVADKVLHNIFEETLPNMVLKDKSFVQRFENAVHSSMQKKLDYEKKSAERRAQPQAKL
jgi:hypothetical protein